MVTRAMASETPATSVPRTYAQKAGDMGTGLVSRLGPSRTAGTWIGYDGRPVVAVTDKDAAAEVQKAGAKAKVVSHSMNELKSATTTLRSAPRVAGTAWAMDYRTNQIVVRGDSTVSSDDWSRMTRMASGIGSFVRMERTEGTFTPRVNGAQAILSTGGRCSAGFNVTNGQSDFILTAGHCGPTGSIWFEDSKATQRVGKTVTQSFPGNDFSLVQYADGKAGDGSAVVSVGDGKGVQITGAADATVGQRVFRSGSTSGLRDGEVTALNATVNYPEGTVTGLIETNVCAEPGDSGGPMFSEGIALGLTSGGSGDCTSGGTTFFEPVTKALADLDVKLLVATPAAGSGSPAPTASGAQGAAGSTSPGSSTPVAGGTTDEPLLSRLTDSRNVGPGLLLIAGSLVALAATRYIRSEQDRKAYRQYYSATWN